jgi:hypothetical protein
MTTKVTGRLGVLGIKETTDVFGLATTVTGGALENMSLASLKVLDSRCGLEKNIDWCVPILLELFYEVFSMLILRG